MLHCANKDMSLSQEISDEIDGGEEYASRDTRLSRWAEQAEALENLLREARDLIREALDDAVRALSCA
jgi:hypothetical protein